MVYTKSALAEQTMPAALVLMDVSEIVSAVSFGDLDLDANHVGGDVSWTPPVGDAAWSEHAESQANLSDGGSRLGTSDPMAALAGFSLRQVQCPAWPNDVTQTSILSGFVYFS